MGSGAALGGIFQGLMNGYDQQQAINRQAAMDAYNRQRQDAADARAQAQFNQEQETYQHNLARRPTVEQQRDQEYGLRSAIQNTQLQGAQHALARQPTLDQQQDASFAMSQQAKRGQIGLQGMQMRLAKAGLDEKNVEAQRQRAQHDLFGGIYQLETTGDSSGLVGAYNAHIAKTFGGSPLKSITPNQDGTLTATSENGSVKQIDGVDQLVGMAGAVTSPEMYVRGLFNRQFGQQEPADIRTARELAKGMTRNPNETDAQLLNRAYDRVRAKGYTDPDDLHMKVYTSALASMKDDFNLSPEEKQQAAMQQADAYVKAAMDRNGRGGGFAAATQGVAPRQPQQQSRQNSQPSSHGRPVATAVDRAGRYGPPGGTVVRYEDGFVAPAQ